MRGVGEVGEERDSGGSSVSTLISPITDKQAHVISAAQHSLYAEMKPCILMLLCQEEI